MAFPIPDKIQELLNKFLRKEDSLYMRREHPKRVQYVYTTAIYRGVPIQVVDKIFVQYESTKPWEIFYANRTGPEGTLVGTTHSISHSPDGIEMNLNI